MTTADRNPNLPISFAPECFEQTGVRVEFVVSRSSLHSGPLVTHDEKQAREFARRAGREVVRREVPVMRRTKWHT